MKSFNQATRPIDSQMKAITCWSIVEYIAASARLQRLLQMDVSSRSSSHLGDPTEGNYVPREQLDAHKPCIAPNVRFKTYGDVTLSPGLTTRK